MSKKKKKDKQKPEETPTDGYQAEVEGGLLEAAIWIVRELDENGEPWNVVKLFGAGGEGMPEKIQTYGMLLNAIFEVRDNYDEVLADSENLHDEE